MRVKGGRRFQEQGGDIQGLSSSLHLFVSALDLHDEVGFAFLQGPKATQICGFNSFQFLIIFLLLPEGRRGTLGVVN